MNLIWFLLQASWQRVAIAGVAGAISGAANTGLLASINQVIQANGGFDRAIVLRFIGLGVVALVTSYLAQVLLSEISQQAVYQMRLRLSQRILSSPLAQLELLGNNKLLATLTEDTDAITGTVTAVPFLCIDGAVIVGCLIYLCWLSWPVFLGVLMMMVGAIALIQGFLYRGARLLRQAREEQDQLFKHFRSITDGIKELKLNRDRRSAFFQEDLKVSAARSRDFNVAGIQVFSGAFSVGQVLFFVILGAIVFGLPQFMPINGITLSSYVLILTFLTDPIQRTLQILPNLSRGTVALQKLEALGLSLEQKSEFVSTHSLSMRQDIQLRQVAYAYHREDEDTPFTLGPIDLTIRSGELLFIIGGNGSGKSTLAKLITGLYQPQQGEIVVDHVPITDKNQDAYRQLFSTVFVDFYLFERLLGISTKADLATETDRYLKKLQLTHKVHLEGDRLSTIELSTGQRKRLALLTAYLEDRPIYVFDEWAAEQDPTFREIFYTELLPELQQQGKTILVISHDDRYFHLGDRVLKLDYGCLVSIDGAR